MSRAELREQRCVTVPIHRSRRHRGRTRNSPSASIEAAAHRALTFRATGILRRIRMRNGGALAVRRHNREIPANAATELCRPMASITIRATSWRFIDKSLTALGRRRKLS